MTNDVLIQAADGVRLDAVWHSPGRDPVLGAVVLAHGISVDMDEGGMFRRLADAMVGEGFGVLRFSFRGHGRSGGTQRGATIAGEMLDLQAAIEQVAGRFDPVSIVAASFGAVSTCMSLPYVEGNVRALVLWNPVLDLRRTFIDPSLPWGVENFGRAQQELLSSQGFFLIDGAFAVGRVLFEEMRHYYPLEQFVRSRVPALVVHGDRDSAVSYGIARAAAQARGCDLQHEREAPGGLIGAVLRRR
ncbi:MAG: alpha/beta fold hydrolase [Actinomycetota bacterium]|nr:alpha/beta fold hydrolase [Actinomycetota bacterium]